MEKEIWKDVVNYEGLYEVSNFGNVRSVDRITIGKRKARRFFSTLLKPDIEPRGYCRVRLSKDLKKTALLVHRIVAQAFIPNPESKPEVNHKNGVKSDNRASELEWSTRSGNMKHAFETGLNPARRGILDVRSKKVVMMDADGNKLKTFACVMDAHRETNICRSHISACANKKPKMKTAGGFKWQFVK